MSAAVVVGRPVDLEQRTFQLKSGPRAGEMVESLSFRLAHASTALGYPTRFEVVGEPMRSEVERAHAAGEMLECVVDLVPIRSQSEDGRDWVKGNVRAVI